MAFPGSTDSFAGFTSTDTLQHDNHASQHNQEQSAIVAIENKVGTGASTPTSTSVLVGNGVGTSAWGQVALSNMVSGVLPTTNGGTGTTSTTGTGSVVFNNAPTISGIANFTGAPSITDFSHAVHNHQNSAGGGLLAPAAVPSLDLTVQTIKNPYKFRAHVSNSWTDGNGAFALVTYDTIDFDTSSNFDAVTNHRFTAPIAGFYSFNACAGANLSNGGNGIIAFYKNGSEYSRGNRVLGTANADYNQTVSDVIQLSAGDYIDVRHFGVGNAGDTGSIFYFSGSMLSTT